MASKSVFQKYDTDALDYFDLASDPIYGVIAGSNVEDVLLTQDETTYTNIREIIAKPTETDQTFINKKKAFVLPSCPVSNDKIKAASGGITGTLSLNVATTAPLVLGNAKL